MTTDKLIRALRVWAEKMTMSGRRELVRQAADRLEELDEAPSVDVMPLDKLCEWLEKNATMYCDTCRATIGSCGVCNSRERWKKC